MEEMKRVDEDWKRRAQQEKVVASGGAPETEGGGRPASGGSKTTNPVFVNFIGGLASQTLMMLGMVEGPDGMAMPPDPGQAQYLIDVLQAIQEKTQGNLSPEEAKNLDQILHELRVAYVAVTKQMGKQHRPKS